MILFRYDNEEQINEWRNLFAHLIEICLEIASLTSPIVSSSSPEGMMPMELTDSLLSFFAFLIKSHFSIFS
jgi:hypothetical protein